MIRNIFLLLRPDQWIKNILIFAGLIFSAKFTVLKNVTDSFYGFILFCLVSSSVYIINDIFDCKKDQTHPEKKKRPIASGAVSVRFAMILEILLLTVAVFFSYKLNLSFFIIIVLYYCMMFLYSIFLRKIIILDSIIIAVGFVLRAISGVYLLSAELSPWLLLCTFLLALMLVFGKRRVELVTLKNDPGKYRESLTKYRLRTLDYFIIILSSGTIISYSLYSFSERTTKMLKYIGLQYTIPFVVFGVLRYVYILIEKNIGAKPEHLLYKDILSLINVILWIISAFIIVILSKQ